MEMWTKSSYSGGNGGDCVEVANSPELVKIRDTRNREAGYLAVPVAEWSAFLADVKDGRL
ncbi:DUF397 domain-containing protein [Allosalinactinospora lopnorensis]|uniref:DUF397 domain-containing protein n=1 Tax=Allosalinactinospora lopnorensis TaxID=1352348 RepID=UPI000623BD0F|nr:DUF397 domain-containing protein [Allosalinactinospora lopnorensis]